MQVDHAGRDDQSRRIQGLRGVAAFQMADFGDLAVLDSEVGFERRNQRAVDNRATPDDAIELSHRITSRGQSPPKPRSTVGAGVPARHVGRFDKAPPGDLRIRTYHHGEKPMPEFDTVIKNGMIVDGTRMPRYRADVGIKDGIITGIGRLASHDAAPGARRVGTDSGARLHRPPYPL